MALTPGTRLGQYEVRALIGVGGMGEVYRAFDTTLEREVALKLLPEMFARDADRLARFKREAKLLASLNHPNIATIHGLEEADGSHFLIMEMVEGETLHERHHPSPANPSRGASPLGTAREQAVTSGLPLDEAIDIAKQICDALEHAHEKTVIHRDLKPANVKLTPEGKVKVLDFGLAKAFAGDGAASGAASPVVNANSPTLSKLPAGYGELSFSPTLPGVILGTAAYMSPEQARGKAVDKRTDIWALGCVLYELLTGQNAFTKPCRDREGAGPRRPDAAKSPLANARGTDGAIADAHEPDTIQDIIARVLQSEPDWSLLPASTPPYVRFILRRCLQKDASKRLRSAADIVIQIEEGSAAPPTVVAQTPKVWQRTMPWAVGALLGLAVGFAVWASKPAPEPVAQTPAHFMIELPPGVQVPASQIPLAVSPDGNHIVVVGIHDGIRQLFMRDLDSQEFKSLSGTEGGDNPFFSPDSQWIGFFASAKLKKIPLAGGPPTSICDSGLITGATWGPDDTIVFSGGPSSGLLRVSASGGKPEEITKMDRSLGEVGHRYPQFLPGGKAVLFSIRAGLGWDENHLAVLRLDKGERKVVLRGAMTGRYVPTGQLIYYRAGSLLAVPFDLTSLEVTGSAPVALVEGVAQSTGAPGAEYTFSDTGSLAYVPASLHQFELRLVWVNRSGEVEPLPLPPRSYTGARFSPDGQRIAVTIRADTQDLWVYDLDRGTMTRLSSEGSVQDPIWSPDGKRVAYTANRNGFRNVTVRASDGTGAEERVTTGENFQQTYSWSPDGKDIAFHEVDPTTGDDIQIVSLEGDRKQRPFLKTTFVEDSPQFSPDGRWLAYRSNESGRMELYVQPFPGPGPKWQISTQGINDRSMWSPNGRELFFRDEDQMWVVDIMTTPRFAAGKPRLLFEGRFGSMDIAPDGQRFLAIQPVEPDRPATQINVVLNWFEELKQKVPVK